MAYKLYLANILFPVTPSKLQIKINNQNKTMNLMNESEVNILKKPGLTEIEFDLLLPNVKYPFAKYADKKFRTAEYYLKFIERLKTNQIPFYFKMIRFLPNKKKLFGTNMKVSLEDYTIKEEAKEGFDAIVSIKLKQYAHYGTKTCNIKFAPEKPRETDQTPEPAVNRTYTIVEGDCLWNIARQFYGDGARFTIIFEANKDQISNPNLIYPGQVLIIPPL